MTHHRPEHQAQQKQQRQAQRGIREQSTAPTFDADRGYWQERYTKEPYYEAGRAFTDYEPGYRAGYDAHQRYSGQTFEDAEPSIQADYERAKSKVKLSWNKARNAARAAWHRLEQAIPGDFDNDGR